MMDNITRLITEINKLTYEYHKEIIEQLKINDKLKIPMPIERVKIPIKQVDYILTENQLLSLTTPIHKFYCSALISGLNEEQILSDKIAEVITIELRGNKISIYLD